MHISNPFLDGIMTACLGMPPWEALVWVRGDIAKSFLWSELKREHKVLLSRLVVPLSKTNLNKITMCNRCPTYCIF